MQGPNVRGVLLGLSALVLACGSPPPPVDAGTDAAAIDDASVLDAFRPPHDAGPSFDLGTAARPAAVLLPTSYDGVTELPLIVLIHADGVTGDAQQRYMHLGEAARAAGAYLAMPTGTRNAMGFLVWNDGITQASPADDVAYLGSVIDQAEAMLPVDRHRIYFVGHSNGGFMAYRMACEAASRIAGIAAINAGDYPSESTCMPSRPVSVLHVHGTMDAVVPYGGAVGVFAGAMDSTDRWRRRASCDGTTTSPATFDMDLGVSGNETLELDYVTGCTGGARVSLFTMSGSVHIPAFTVDAGQRIVDWLLARTSP
jgi:polyhydroxybutyrate depolymerase